MAKLKHICIDARLWGVKEAGVGRYTQELVENVLRLKPHYRFTLLMRHNDARKFNFSSVEIKILNAHPYSLKGQFLIPFLLRKLQPDLIHIPSLGIPYLWRGNMIVTIHDLLQFNWAHLLTSTRSPLIHKLKLKGCKRLIRWSIFSSKLIITPTNYTASQIKERFGTNKDKIIITYEGINKAYFQKKQLAHQFIINKYGLHSPFIIYTGNAYPYKNISTLLAGLNKIKKNIPNLILVVVRPYSVFTQRLEEEIEKTGLNNSVKLLGYVPDKDLSDLYQMALAYVSASFEEGFGLTPLEAIASGCFPIVSDIPAFREILAKHAWYFNPKSADHFAQKIIKFSSLSAKEKQKMKTQARKHASKYTWQKTAQKTLKAYHKALRE